MMKDKETSIARVSEIAGVLAQHGHLRCAPTIAGEDGRLVLTVVFAGATADDGLDILALSDELRWIVAVAQIRRFVEIYGFDPKQFEMLMQTQER